MGTLTVAKHTYVKWDPYLSPLKTKQNKYTHSWSFLSVHSPVQPCPPALPTGLSLFVAPPVWPHLCHNSHYSLTCVKGSWAWFLCSLEAGTHPSLYLFTLIHSPALVDAKSLYFELIFGQIPHCRVKVTLTKQFCDLLRVIQQRQS